MSILPAATPHLAALVVPADDVAPGSVDDAGPSLLDAPDGLRLIWAPNPEQRIHGVWWPRSRNITVELAELMPAADSRLGAPLSRVSLNPDAWDHQPRRLYAGKRVIRLAWFTLIDPATVGIGATSLTRIMLCVIPPESPASAGQRILRTLLDGGDWPSEPSQILQIGVSRAGASA